MHFYTFLRHTCVIGEENKQIFGLFLLPFSVEEREVVFAFLDSAFSCKGEVVMLVDHDHADM